MDKQQIMSFINDQLTLGRISKEDLALLIGVGTVQANPITSAPNVNPVVQKEEHSKNLINTFYGIGAVIVLGGIAVLIGQNWEQIGFAGRMLVTIGLSLVTYISGMLVRNPQHRMLSQVMFALSCALAPVGVVAFLLEKQINFTWPYTLFTPLVLLILYGYAYFYTRKNVLFLITLGYASWVYYSVLVKLFSFTYDASLMKWALMILGISYIFIAVGYDTNSYIDETDKKEKDSIRNLVIAVGTCTVLFTGITIGGFFDILYILVLFSAFYGSVYLKSRSMLTLGAVFLMSHIVKLTSKYFVDSLGWPVTLIFTGFTIIAIGYLTYNLNKKYISNS